MAKEFEFLMDILAQISELWGSKMPTGRRGVMKRYSVTVTDGVYVRKMKLEHILRDPPAISYSVESLQQAKAQGAVTLRCNVLHTIYEISLSDFELYSFEVNRGWGEQRACRLSHFSDTPLPVKTKKPRTLNTPSIAKTPAKQLLLKGFSGGGLWPLTWYRPSVFTTWKQASSLFH